MKDFYEDIKGDISERIQLSLGYFRIGEDGNESFTAEEIKHKIKQEIKQFIKLRKSSKR